MRSSHRPEIFPDTAISFVFCTATVSISDCITIAVRTNAQVSHSRNLRPHVREMNKIKEIYKLNFRNEFAIGGNSGVGSCGNA